jgi:GNAT superfamily N-acetyltransferase
MADAPLLWDYLRLSIFVRPGDPPTPSDEVSRPEIACYVEDWGRYGDDGVLAVDDATGADLGAAWLRLWPGVETGYGFVDRSTPELAIAVRPEHRGRGIGTCLLDTLLDRASQRHRAVSLSVSLENPASGPSPNRRARSPCDARSRGDAAADGQSRHDC